MSDYVTVTRPKPGRVDAECSKCKAGVDAPDHDFGRAMIDAFTAQHRHGGKK